MKRMVSILMILVFSISVMTGCSAAPNDVSGAEQAGEVFILTMQIDNPQMTVNGTETEIDPGRGTVPVEQSGRTLVPIRAIIEAMGGAVTWEEATQTVTLTLGSDTIRLVIDSTTAYLNEAADTLDVAPTTIHDRTMLPIRFIAESFRFDVDWEEETQTVTITKETENTGTPAVLPTEGGKALVVYYSASGNTEEVATYIAQAADAGLFELVPTEPYTSADLNWTDQNSRVTREHENEAERVVELVSANVENWADYDTVFIGYPIWWGIAAWAVDGFVKANDFTGKTVIPFCTSSSSGLGESGRLLAEMAGTGDWQEGMRFRSHAPENEVKEWARGVIGLMD